MRLGKRWVPFTTAHLAALSLCLAAPLSAQAPATPAPQPAQTLVDAAVKTAKAEHKAVLVEFGASWCGWCHRFDAFLHAPVVGKLMTDNYVIVSLTVDESPDKKALDNPGAAELMKAMRGGGELPYFFFLDATGKKLADANVEPDGTDIGHPDTPVEVDAFDKLLQATAPHMTAAQRAQIHEFLTKMAAKGSG
jgi:thiol:disulfide interchange protein